MAIGRITGQMLSANLARSGTDLTFETNLLALDVSNSRVGIGTASPATTLHISATDALRLPSGSDAQRPGSPANGDIRYNSDQTTIEGYANGGWANLASGTELKDSDEDTKVNVEASADLDEIHFDIAGTQRGKISATTVEWGVTGISTTASTITSLTTNGDITLTPNGTGKVIVTDGTTLQTNTADINGGAIDGVTIGSNSAATALVANGGINIDDDGDGAIDGVVIGANTAAAGTFTDLTANGTIDIDSTGTGNIDNVVIGANTAAAGSFTTIAASGNATISGNLTVNGTTTTIDSETLTIEDPLLTLAKNNSGGAANTFDQGLFFNRGSDDNVSFLWDESADQFAFAVTSGEDGTTAGAVTIDSYAAIQAGVTTVSDLETGSISAADGTEAATIANSTGVITIPSAVLTTADINGGTVDGVTIGGASAGAGTFTNLTVNTDVDITDSGGDGTIDGVIIGGSTAAAATFTTATATNVQATNIKANDGTAAIAIADSTGAVTISTAVELDGGNVTINESSAAVDFRVESNGHAHALFVDGSENHVGIKTAAPEYDLDVSGSIDALRLPNGTTSERPTGATGIIRFNTTTGKYEGCQDGSTFVDFATAGTAPTFTKESTTGDGSSTTFAGFFSTAPESANNVFVYIDNVYQEPTENYSVSGTNITFTSAPHSGARIFAITGADNSSLVTGGVARSETSSVNFTSSATTIMSFSAVTYRSAELFIQMQDTANTEYSAMKAVVTHDGSTAYITVFGITNSGSTDLGTVTAEHDGSSTVNVKAVSTGGQTAAKVQYSLVAA
jgi:hypothetical protein